MFSEPGDRTYTFGRFEDFTALLEILIPERHPVRNMGEDLFALHLETPVGSLISRLVPSELSLLLLARASTPL